MSSPAFVCPCFTLSIVEVITSLLEEHGQGGACAENDPRLGGGLIFLDGQVTHRSEETENDPRT